MRRAPLLLALAATAAGAEDRYPDTSFFTGVYERVGRDEQSPPGLIDDLLRIEPAAEGWGLRISRCAALDEPGWPLDLRHSEYDEVPNILEGRDGSFGLWCQYFTDHSNYPILTCGSEMGARFTLWAVTDDRAAECGAAP